MFYTDRAPDYLEQRSSKHSREGILERKICDFQVPNNAICFSHKLLPKLCFKLLNEQLLVPREIGNNTLVQNFVEKRNFIMWNGRVAIRLTLQMAMLLGQL